jgi:predicted GNAT family acetyltransferase
MHTWPVALQARSSVRDQLFHKYSVPRLTGVQAAIAKKGYKAKMALDAVHETIDSTTKVVYFCRSKLVARRGSSNTL